MNVRIRTTFVGREPEPATLAEHLVHARAGRPQVVLVEGDPGTGKTALVALLDRLRIRGGPIVMVVDDAHWADLPSLQAVVFALRRLGSDRVLTVVATRPGDGGRLERLRTLAAGERGTVLRLGGLGDDGLVALGRAGGRAARRCGVGAGDPYQA